MKKTLFDKIYKLTEEVEKKYNMPLLVNGLFFNTSYGLLDAEGVGIDGRGMLIRDYTDLKEFLHMNKTTVKETAAELKNIIIED